MSSAAFGASIAVKARALRPRQPLDRLSVAALIASVSFACYILSRLLDGGVATAFSVVGVGACGWAWLVARALFDPAEHEAAWVLVVCVVVAATGAVSALAPEGELLSRVAGNGYAISGSAALLLTFVEPFHRPRSDLPAAETRFRLVFLIVHTLLVAISVLGLRAEGDTPQAVAQDDMIKAACASAALTALVAAVLFRRRHPLTATAAAPPRRAPTADDLRLAERLGRLLSDEALDRQPDLKIGEVAARLREPEHRVSQCISVALGFANFNRWINHHRIEHAKALLAQPGDRRSILEIAFTCGFASLGPFNRAFRDQVGTTPRAYRALQQKRDRLSQP